MKKFLFPPALIAALAGIILLTGCGSAFYPMPEEEISSPAPAATRSDSPDSSYSHKAGNVVSVGGTVYNDGLAITFEKAENCRAYVSSSNDKKGIRLRFTVKNNASEDRRISSTDFSCYADGASCRMDYSIADMLVYTELSPGRSASGWLCFEVPVQAKAIEVEYELNWRTQEKAVFIVDL